VSGNTRTRVVAPSLQYQSEPGDLVYCATNLTNPGTYNASDSSLTNLPRFPCVYASEFDVADVTANGFFMASDSIVNTMVISSGEGNNCTNLLHPGCIYETVQTESYYVAQPELFTVLIDHSIAVPTLDIYRSAQTMTGTLLDPDGNPVDTCLPYLRRNLPCPAYIGFDNPEGLDILAVESLLDAAGISSLDTAAGDTPELMGRSLRDSGVVFIMELQYTNYNSYEEDVVSYTAFVSAVADSKYKRQIPIPGPGEITANRTVLDQHGLKVFITQNGRIGRFNPSTLLIVLVTSMGLLAVATTLVNTVMLQAPCCPMRYI